ncbi:MAG: O-antigen ligase family protein [Pirellulales bacterium]|nr:O-antigen ligase family protein [Pirellulales bacterium]
MPAAHRHSTNALEPTTSQRLQAGLLRVIDGGLASCLLVVPMVMGGRHAIGQLVLVSLVIALSVAWAVHESLSPRPTWRPTRAVFVLLAGVLLLVAQLAPLPRNATDAVAPHTHEILPLWNAGAEASIGLGTWQRLSLTPAATRGALAVYLAYGLLFLVTVQRIRHVEDVERLLCWTAISGIAMATFGLFQHFAGNGKFFWIHEAPYASAQNVVKGSFTNRNHFAQFMALGIGPVIWWLHRTFRHQSEERRGAARESRGAWRRRESQGYVLVIAAGVVFFAGLLSLSRGGNVAMFVAVTISSVVCCRAADVRSRFIGTIAGAGVFITVALAVFGYDRVSDRLSNVASGEVKVLDMDEARRRIWKTDLRAVPDFAAIGSGVGSHAEVYPMYLDEPMEGREYTHAENGYIQVALETGVTGLALVGVGMGFCGFWCVGGLRRAESTRLLACLGAVSAGLAANALHSAADFVWYVPGCMVVVAVLAGCACRGWQLAVAGSSGPPAARPMPLFAAPVFAIAVVAFGSFMAWDRLGAAAAQVHWDRYLLDVCRREAEAPPPADATPADGSIDPAARAALERAANEDAVRVECRRIAHLEQVVRWQPGHARAQLALAQSHLQLFDLLQVTAINPMSLPNVRDAALRSQSSFPSREARDAWLRRAVGEHCKHLYLALRHAREALWACPLQGKAYLYLAELGFLDGATDSAKRACVEQAVRVRPYDGYVLYTAANEAWLAGEPAQWLSLAKEASRCSRIFQKRLLEDLIQNTAPEGLEHMIGFVVKEFQLDLVGLESLEAACRERGQPEQLIALRQFVAQSAEHEARSLAGGQAAATWLIARRLYAALGENAQALRCARNAYECQPNRFDVRLELAQTLLNQGLCAEAQGHLHWCLRRRTGDARLERLYRQALDGRLDQQAARDRQGPT